VVGLLVAAGGCSPYRYAVPDGDLFGADEDVLDEEAQDALAYGHVGGGGCVAELVEEAFEVVGEGEVGVAVGELGLQSVELAVQGVLAGPQVGHAGAELVDGDELFLEGFDHPGDRGGGLGQGEFEAGALAPDGVGGAGPLEAFVDLGADQGRVGDQGGDVVPDDGVEVVGADGFAGADAPVLVAPVVGAEAPVVVDLVACAGGGVAAAVAVSAGHAGDHALRQGGDLAVAGGELLVVGQALGGPLERGLVDDGGDGDDDPLLAGAVDGLDRARGGAALQAGDAVEPRQLVDEPGLAVDGLACVGGVAEHAPDHAAVPAGLAGACEGIGVGEPAGRSAMEVPSSV
jgi:hypothetical protein